MTVQAILTGVLPSLGVLGIFVFVMRGIVRADRREREEIAAYDRAHPVQDAGGEAGKDAAGA